MTFVETQLTSLLAAIVMAILGFLLVAYVLKICYNFAVVDGLSVDPVTGEARLMPINFAHACVLYILLALFIAPTVIAPKS